ncbi:MAG: TrbI/VirB10 family protein [Candidatus Baltobacteraceae bacterium]
MRDASAESLVNVGGPETAGIITIRRSILVAAGVTAVFLGFLAAWLIHSNAPVAAVGAPLPARAADVSTIDEKVARGSDALVMPTTRPAPNPTLDPQMIADNGVVPMTQPTAAVPAQQGPSAAEQSAIARQQAADEAARARRQIVEDARDSGLAVKLDDDESAQRTSAGAANVAAAGADSGPAGEYVIQRGTIIPASLYTPIDSTVPGMVTAQVRQDVYDSTHRTLLVPQGSRLVGSYMSGITNGQARLFVGFDSIKLPNGHTINLGNMPGVDLQGVAGLGGKVDFHTGRLFGNIVLLSILGAATQLVQPRYSDGGTSVVVYGAGQGASQQIGSVSSQVASQYLNQPPTMHTPAGYVLDVMVEHDLSLLPYEEGSR